MVHEKETVDTIASTLNLKNRKDVVNKVEALKEDLKEAKVEIEQLSAKLNAICRIKSKWYWRNQWS